MEPLVAVYRLVDNNDHKIKFGYTWIKKEEDAIERVKLKLDKHEILQTIWSVDWRQENCVYRLCFGDVTIENRKGPEEDVARTLRQLYIKAKSSRNWRIGSRKEAGGYVAKPKEEPKALPPPKKEIPVYRLMSVVPAYIPSTEEKA